MSTHGTELRIAEMVVRHTSEALLKPREAILPSSRLLMDLDAESIDIVDIRFRLEDELGFKIDQRAMMEAVGEDLTAEEFSEQLTVQFVIDYVTTLVSDRADLK